MPIVREDVLRTLAFDIFSATGVPVEDARIVADHLVNSHMAGHDSHGTWFLPGYARSMKKGYVPWEDREIMRENGRIGVAQVQWTIRAGSEARNDHRPPHPLRSRCWQGRG